MSLVAFVSEKVIEVFGKKAIDRWSKARSEAFFKSFCEDYAEELSRKDKNWNERRSLDDRLSDILQDESSSQALYESYRKVYLSKSSRIGPKIIGFLTAELISNSRSANPEEEIIFEVAESLSDTDLEEFYTYYRGAHRQATDDKDHKSGFFLNRYGSLNIELKTHETDSAWHSKAPDSIGALSLAAELGRWAQKLEQIGILFQETKQSSYDYKEDSERHIDQDGTVTKFQWIASFGPGTEKLIILLTRCFEVKEHNASI